MTSMSQSPTPKLSAQWPDNRVPTVAVIIATFNEMPDRVARTLSSCTIQTLPFAQIFVVDDGSDSPLQLPEGHDTRVEVVRLDENGGVSRARNAALAKCTADFVLCLN